MSTPDPRPDREPEALEPLEADPVPVVAAGTALWATAFVVLLLLRERLDEAGNGRWLWTTLAGTGLGLIGTAWCVRRRERLRRQSPPPPSPPSPPASP